MNSIAISAFEEPYPRITVAAATGPLLYCRWATLAPALHRVARVRQQQQLHMRLSVALAVQRSR